MTEVINKAYSCISLMKDDYQDEAYEQVKDFTDEQMQIMADYIGEWLYDGDQWEMAIEAALERMKEL